MDNIISKIIQIDELAQEKLKQSEALKEKTMTEVAETIARHNADAEAASKEKLSIVFENESAAAEADKVEIGRSAKDKISQLEDIFSRTHEDLEKEIFDNVLKL